MNMYKTSFGPAHNAPLSVSTAICESTCHLSLIEPFICLGGPCSIESSEQVESIFPEIAPHVTFFRGGVFRAGTYPSSTYGWQLDLLKMFHDMSRKFGRPNVVDVLDIRDLETIDSFTDVFQVGMRQAQHYALLKELGRTSKPVILKRGSWQKLSEFLGSLEYILRGGNSNVILCERGGVTHLDHVRWDLSISMIAKLKQITGFKVIVDASHGTGDSKLVKPMTLAGIAAGADGCLIETHNNPSKSMSDAEQAVSIEEFVDIVKTAKEVSSCLRRE